jgi:hypothetical protein
MVLKESLADADVEGIGDLLYHEPAQIFIVLVQRLPHLLQCFLLLIDFLQHLDLRFIEQFLDVNQGVQVHRINRGERGDDEIYDASSD